MTHLIRELYVRFGPSAKAWVIWLSGLWIGMAVMWAMVD